MNVFEHSGCCRLLGYLSLAILSLTGLIGIPLVHQNEYSLDNLQQRVSRHIQILEKGLQEQTTRIVQQVQMDSAREDFGFLEEKGSPGNVAVFIFKHDTLRYWSDQSIPYYAIRPAVDTSTITMQHLANGWYLMKSSRVNNIVVVAFTRVKMEYPFQNQYLKNGFSFASRIPSEIKLSLTPTDYNLYSVTGDFLVGLSFSELSNEPAQPGWLVVFLALTYLFLLLCLDEACFSKKLILRDDRWRLVLIIAVLALLRTLQYSSQWPSILYETAMFTRFDQDPCWLFPSLGDFLLNGFLMLAVVSIFYFRWPERIKNPLVTRRKFFLLMIARYTVSIVFLAVIMEGVYSMVASGNLPLNLEQISRFTVESVPALFGLAFWLLAWVLFALRLSDYQLGKPSFFQLFLALVLVSLCTTIIFHRALITGEKGHRKEIARKLTHRENSETERQLREIANTLNKDTQLHARLTRSMTTLTPVQSEDSIVHDILDTYFAEGWNNFSVQVTICTRWKELRVQPQGYLIGCNLYFQKIISDFGKPDTLTPVVFLDYGYGNEDYILHITDPLKQWDVFVELSSLTVYKDSGYPELLVDRSAYDFPEMTDYSFAFYDKGQLVQRVGNYSYGYDLGALVDTVTLAFLLPETGMDHMVYPIDRDSILLISIRQTSWLNTLASFLYLLLFLLILFSIGYVVVHAQSVFTFSLQSLRHRLQLAMLGLILTSFFILGIVMIVNLIALNSQKNKENLLERMLSILVEVEHKFDYLDNLDQLNQEELESVLIKFSNVFFSDINLYEPSGILKASSRVRIFQEGLISNRINPEALVRLREKKTGMFVLTESIGRLDYLSAYVPFYNSSNRLLGYLNLPYFSKQDDLKREISSFLVAFINIYVLFMLLGVLLTYLISNYITSPLKLLASRLGAIRLGRSSEKLTWKHQDEIGRLVEEYNRMLDELAISAKKLIISERETAWREMAQQVAHEIKNPLTPMKLGVQHLLQTWQDNPSNWTDRLNRFADALIVQIDTLSRIASEFTYFAKMPEPENETLNLDELVQVALTIYTDVSSIRFHVDSTRGEKWIHADRNQISRVLNNVLNNAIQALEGQTDGYVHVKVSEGEIYHMISITDNGKGISPTEADLIFQPRFTTKSGGTGLGLAIVQGIIHSVGGTITFESQPGVETTFFIRFPAVFPNPLSS